MGKERAREITAEVRDREILPALAFVRETLDRNGGTLRLALLSDLWTEHTGRDEGFYLRLALRRCRARRRRAGLLGRGFRGGAGGVAGARFGRPNAKNARGRKPYGSPKKGARRGGPDAPGKPPPNRTPSPPILWRILARRT